jgi:hypothetical protein
MRKNPRRILSYTRTKNKGLTAIATSYYEMPLSALLTTAKRRCVALHRTRSGLLVGTKLGTIKMRLTSAHNVCMLPPC